MARLFIFGIGGTGSRVLKALTLLLATGVDCNGYEIVPIFIDPHKDLPEFKDCRELISLYADVRRQAYPNFRPADRAFFKTPILSLNDIVKEGFTKGFDFDERIDDTFGHFLGLDLLEKGDINRDLIELLYSERNLNTPLSVGFKGNPNIGSVVLNKFDEASWYTTFQKIFSEGDQIFIVSSIFGGTGAAGFPLLVKNLRESDNKYIKNAPIGALPVMPYFKLTDPEEDADHQDIDSNSFFTKTKSALSYYEKHLTGVNFLYYLADLHEQSRPYKNDEKLQENKAHLIELIGASAIIDFCHQRDKTTQQSQYLQYTPGENSSPIHFFNIGNKLRNQIYLEMVNFYIFSCVHPSFKTHTDATFIKNGGFDAQFFRSDAVVTIEKFINVFFLKWIKELDENDRRFSPLNLDIPDDRFHKVIVGNIIKEKKNFFTNNKLDSSNYINSMETCRNTVADIADKSKFSRYLVLSQQAIEAVNKDKFKIQSN